MSSVHIVQILMQLVSPAHTGSDLKTGSETLFRKLKFIVGNRIEELPYISGNEVRGQLRRMIMRDFIKMVGYEIRSLRLYHALFSGGVLEEVEEQSVPMLDIELRRKIRKYIVPASLLGLAIGNQVVEGKLKVMHVLPVCRELSEYLPEWVVRGYEHHATRSCYEYLDWTFHTRHAEERRTSAEEQAVQMIYRFEVLTAGALLYTELVCDDCNDVEISCLSRMIKLWQLRPYVGGKSATGYGKVKFVNIRTRALTADGEEGEFALDDSKYREFVMKNKDYIVKVLQELDR